MCTSSWKCGILKLLTSLCCVCFTQRNGHENSNNLIGLSWGIKDLISENYSEQCRQRLISHSVLTIIIIIISSSLMSCLDMNSFQEVPLPLPVYSGMTQVSYGGDGVLTVLKHPQDIFLLCLQHNERLSIKGYGNTWFETVKHHDHDSFVVSKELRWRKSMLSMACQGFNFVAQVLWGMKRD